MDLSPYRERMVRAILDLHFARALEHFPVGRENEPAVRRETETYRPLAEADVDAIIEALK